MESPDPYATFREAVLDLVEEPTPANAKRALAASRLLERARRRSERRTSDTGDRRRAIETRS
jgi:hypothetical protein